jgi:hypothetical protein
MSFIAYKALNDIPVCPIAKKTSVKLLSVLEYRALIWKTKTSNL